jgi:hypothetical protein
VIALTKDPQVMGRANLSLTYRVEDDYGVVSAEAKFINPQIAKREGGPEPRPLVGAPDFSLTLPQVRTRTGTGESSKDVTEHPWAGVKATLRLVARDDGGNEGMTEGQEISLPERPFSKPLARALVEQRRAEGHRDEPRLDFVADGNEEGEMRQHQQEHAHGEQVEV